MLLRGGNMEGAVRGDRDRKDVRQYWSFHSCLFDLEGGDSKVGWLREVWKVR